MLLTPLLPILRASRSQHLGVAKDLILGQDGGVNESTVNLLQGAADEVRRVKTLLKSHGIESTLGEPPEGCGNS